MEESLRALLHRQADELADKLEAMVSGAKPKASPEKRRREPRHQIPKMPAPREMTPERQAAAEAALRRVGM